VCLVVAMAAATTAGCLCMGRYRVEAPLGAAAPQVRVRFGDGPERPVPLAGPSAPLSDVLFRAGVLQLSSAGVVANLPDGLPLARCVVRYAPNDRAGPATLTFPLGMAVNGPLADLRAAGGELVELLDLERVDRLSAAEAEAIKLQRGQFTVLRPGRTPVQAKLSNEIKDIETLFGADNRPTFGGAPNSRAGEIVAISRPAVDGRTSVLMSPWVAEYFVGRTALVYNLNELNVGLKRVRTEPLRPGDIVTVAAVEEVPEVLLLLTASLQRALSQQPAAAPRPR
jgi:hypothetical protein